MGQLSHQQRTRNTHSREEINKKIRKFRNACYWIAAERGMDFDSPPSFGEEFIEDDLQIVQEIKKWLNDHGVIVPEYDTHWYPGIGHVIPKKDANLVLDEYMDFIEKD